MDTDTADAWFEEGVRALALSRTADTASQLRDDLEDALVAFDAALAREPGHAGALRERGFVLARLDRHEAAVDAFAAALGPSPDDPALVLASAQSLATLGRHQAALDAFESVLRTCADDAEARFGRAAALTALGRDELAVRAWDEVLREEADGPTDTQGRTTSPPMGSYRRPRARLARAACIARLGRPDAQAAFHEAFAGAVGMPGRDFYEALATFESARAAWHQYVASRAEQPAAWHRAGQAWLAAGRSGDALAAYEQLLQLAPGDSRAWFGKAEAHAQAGLLDEAIAAYRQSLALEPGFLGASARLRVIQERAAARATRPTP